MEKIVSKIIPIVLLMLLGYAMKRMRYIQPSFFIGLKKMVIDFALPCLLFISFIDMELKIEHISLTLCIIIFLLFQNTFGRILNKIKPLSDPVLPNVLSGTSVALIGIPLYTAAFGMENVSNLAILTIGHEIFIWLIWASLIRLDFAENKFNIAILKKMFTSPLIIAVITGLCFNLFGFSKYFQSVGVLVGIFQTCSLLSKLCVPLILLVVGHDLVFEKKYSRLTVTYTLIRRLSFLGFGLLLTFFILPNIMEMTIFHYYAMVTFFIMPPPLVISTFIHKAGGSEEQVVLANNVFVLDVFACIISFIILIFIAEI